MKAQMKFQKYICLLMIIMGALGVLYAFLYCSGGLDALGQMSDPSPADPGKRLPRFFATEPGKYDWYLYQDIQGFNTAMFACGIVMILTAVLLYITACHKRRNYYISNYVATGVCAGSNIIISLVLMVMNGIWRGKFVNVDFEAWRQYYKTLEEIAGEGTVKYVYSESTLWFDLGFVVYLLIIVASVLLILNLVWKIKLMQGEKKLLAGEALEGGIEA